MKNLFIIVLGFFFLMSCKSSEKEIIEIRFHYEKKDDAHFLVMTLKNLSDKPIYMPFLASWGYGIDEMVVLNSKGETINDDFHMNELNYNRRFYGRGGEGKFITDYCSDDPMINDEIDLDLPPFNEKKDMVRSIIQHEYESLVSKKQLLAPTEEDIRFIKGVIFNKYNDVIFLNPGEVYHNCYTINSLYESDETYKVFFRCNFPEKYYEESENFYYVFKYKKDSVLLTPYFLPEFKGYFLYDQPFASDTLIINP